MFAAIRNILTPPVFPGNHETTLKARLLNRIIIILWLGGGIALGAMVLRQNANLLALLIVTIFLAGTIGLNLVRRGRVLIACKLITITLWGLVVGAAIFWRELSPASTVGFATALVTAALLTNRRWSLLLLFLSVLACGIVYVADLNDWWSPLIQTSRNFMYLNVAINLSVIALIMIEAQNGFAAVIEQARHSVAQIQAEIAERKRIEDALHQSQALYRTLMENTREAITMMDRDGHFLLMNEAAARQMGGKPEDFVGRTLQEVLPAETAQERMRSLKLIFDTGQGAISDTYVPLHGRKRWFHASSQPITDSSGVVTAVANLAIDITERKQAEDAIREKEERLRQAVRVGNIGIFDHDQIADVIYSSPEERAIYGLDPDESVTIEKYFTRIHPDDRDRLAAAVQRAHDPAGDGNFEVEHRVIRNGEIRWLTTRSQTFFEGEGAARHPVRTVGAVLDITERKRAEEALRESEASLQEAQRIAKLGSFSYDPDAQTLICSEQARAILGLEPGKPVTLALCCEKMGRNICAEIADGIAQMAQPDALYEIEHSISMSPNEDRTLHFYARSLPTGNHIFGIVQDITESKLTQEILQMLNQELEFAVLELGNERNLLRSVLNAIPVRVFWKDRDLNFLGCNELFAQDAQIGTPLDILGKSDYELGPPDYVEQYRADDRVVIDSGEPRLNYEEPQMRGDSMRWLRTSKVPLRDANDDIIGVMGTYEDVTERKQIRQALADSEARYRALAHSLPGIIVGMLDHDLRLVLLDGSEVESLGLSKVDMEGKFITDVFSEQILQQLMPMVQAALAGETRVNEIAVTYDTYRITHAPVMDGNNNITGVISVGVNITEIKRADAALRESEAKLKEAQQLGKIGNFEFNIDDQSVTWSDEVYRIFGYEVGTDVTLEAYRRRLKPEDFEHVMALVSTALETGEPYVVENDIFLESGITRRVYAQGRPLEDASGRRTRIFGVVQDISERRQIEAERERLAAIVSNSSDFIGIADNAGINLYMNPAGMQAIQCENPEKYIGQSIRLIHDDETANYVFSEVIPTVLKTGKWRGETCMKREDGSLFPVDQTIFKLHDTAGGAYEIATVCRDISEQKRTENALRESEARYAALVNQTRDGVLVVQDGQMVHMNEPMADMLGSTVKELQGTAYLDFIAPESQAQITEYIKARMAGEPAPSRYEAKLRKKDGTIFDVEISAARVQLNGSPASMGLLRDITARKRDERALRESEERFRGLFEQLPLGAFLTAARAQGTRAAVIVDCNEAAARMNGYTREQLIGQPIEIFMANKERVTEKDRSAFWDQVREEGFVTLEDDRLRRDGSVYPAQSTVSMMEIQGEELLLIIERDITEAKHAEAALRASERRFRALFEKLPLGVTLVVPRGGSVPGEIIDCNEAAAAMHGYTRQELIGQSVDILTVEAMAKSDPGYAMLDAVRAEGTISYEVIHQHKDGTLFPVEGSATTIDVQGVEAIMGIDRDITDRRRAQEERETMIAELEAKNAELERFTYTVSHDLKSPLITIRGFLGYLEDDAHRGNFDRMRADIERIGNATVKMERLLNELLELSRIGRKMNPPESVPFDHLVREGMELVQGRLKARGIAVEVATGAPEIYGDRARLIEVMQNLLDNAAKFMGNQPDPRIEMGAHVDGAQTVIYVKDNGVGIAPEYHEKVFSLFDKLDVDSEGTGVGLALVKRIVEVHGGKIWVESAGIGHGSTFWFSLPNAPASGRE
ncbi:MAG: PAS domain S-box protein [Anaerolineae bacterium]|nr:PAS domain S-box protein [Anaerolineae bacterium]